MILVVGATGQLGSSITRLLAAQDRPVRAVARPSSAPGSVEALRQLGVEIVEADLKDRASLARVCTGVTEVISTATTTLRDQTRDSLPLVDRQGQLDLVAAATQAGVKHFVYLSYPEVFDATPLSPLSHAKRAVESALKSSGMTYTILQPGAFLEVWMSPTLGFDYPHARVRVLGDGSKPVAWISLTDVARYAAASLDQPGVRNVVLPLVAENVSVNDAVREFEAATGRTFDVTHVPLEALEAQRMGAVTPLDQSFAALMTAVARGVPLTPDARQATFGFSTMTVREYARRAVNVTAVS